MSDRVDRHIAEKILGWNYRKVLRWFESGKIKSASRTVDKRGSPWKCDRQELIELKNANSPQ